MRVHCLSRSSCVCLSSCYDRWFSLVFHAFCILYLKTFDHIQVSHFIRKSFLVMFSVYGLAYFLGYHYNDNLVFRDISILFWSSSYFNKVWNFTKHVLTVSLEKWKLYGHIFYTPRVSTEHQVNTRVMARNESRPGKEGGNKQLRGQRRGSRLTQAQGATVCWRKVSSCHGSSGRCPPQRYSPASEKCLPSSQTQIQI